MLSSNNHKISEAPLWYAIRTKPREEVRAESNLKAWGLKTFSPRVKDRSYNQFNDKPIDRIKPLFPGYIFAQFNASLLLHKVSFARGVSNVVSFSSGPTPVDEDIIAEIQSQVGRDGCVTLGDEINRGDRVTIKSGILENLSGIVEHEMTDSDSLMVLLSSLSYQGRLIVEKTLVRKINGRN